MALHSSTLTTQPRVNFLRSNTQGALPLQLQESVEPAQAFALVWHDFYSFAAVPRANGSQALVRGVRSWFRVMLLTLEIVLVRLHLRTPCIAVYQVHR